MLLSARPLIHVADVNHYRVATVYELVAGNATTLFLQLIDASQMKDASPPGLRYMPSAGATLSVTLENLNPQLQISRVATQPFAQDASIWSVPILSTDPIVGTRSLRLTLQEGTVQRTARLQGVLRVDGFGERC